jgi:hypothetical protein
VTSVEVGELEIDVSGVDRFTTCPPPGELGQAWIPKIPPWTAPSPAASAPHEDTPGLGPASGGSPDVPAASTEALPGEHAFALTHEPFRRCYARGLTLDPTQDGHVAIVLRVGGDGRIARVESYGACEIARQTIVCMQDAAKQIRLSPPEAGSDTIVVPAVFAQTGQARRTSPSVNEAYTTGAFVTVESLRPAFHACEESARRQGQSPRAAATFTLELDAGGRVLHAHVDPWSGNQQLLACAATSLERLVFAAPPGRGGSVRARVSFNPGMVVR